MSSKKQIRLDKAVSDISKLSRNKSRKLIESGTVFVNGRVCFKHGLITTEDDEIVISENIEPIILRPELVERNKNIRNLIKVIFEDEYIIVLNKPSMIHSVRIDKSEQVTVADLLASISSDYLNSSPSELEAGLVNRIDFYTSGLIVAAKSKDVWKLMSKKFKTNSVEKNYIALVEGNPKLEILECFIKLEKNKERVKTFPINKNLEDIKNNANLLSCSLKIERIENFNKFSLVEIKAKHLVRHQIRAIFSEFNHPLVGDEIYNSRYSLTEAMGIDGIDKINLESRPGFYLECRQIKFEHPILEEITEINL